MLPLETQPSQTEDHTLLSSIFTKKIIRFLYKVILFEKLISLLADVDLARFSRGLHPVGQRHIVGPHVELEPLSADDATEDGAGVDADPHVDILVALLVKLLDGPDHAQPHLDAVVGVVLSRLGTSLQTDGLK